MKEEKLGKMLNELADVTAEPVRPDFAEDIKQRIPHRLAPYRSGIDTVNIIIDLRVSKLVAAAAIIITMVLWGSFFRGRDSVGSDLYKDGKMLVRNLLGAGDEENKALAARSGYQYNVFLARSRYQYLVQKGEEIAYYGDNIKLQDSNAVLMQWKLSDGNYRVIFADLRGKTVSAEELIELQARMLQKKAK
jgi:hypothetical protein